MEDGIGGTRSEVEREANDPETQLLRDRFRLSAISIAESEGQFHYLTPLRSLYLVNLPVFTIFDGNSVTNSCA